MFFFIVLAHCVGLKKHHYGCLAIEQYSSDAWVIKTTDNLEKYETFQSLRVACCASFRGCSRPLRQANCPDDMCE